MIFFSSGRNHSAARFSGGGVGCLIFGILGLIAAWYILKGLFYLLYWASPALLVLSLIINWRAAADTVKDWLGTLKTNPLGGLVSAALAVLLFPVFTLYLFLKALGYNKMEQMRRDFGQKQAPAEGEFVEFEELESTPKEGPAQDTAAEPPVLPEKDAPQARVEPKKPENPYDQFFGK